MLSHNLKKCFAKTWRHLRMRAADGWCPRFHKHIAFAFLAYRRAVCCRAMRHHCGVDDVEMRIECEAVQRGGVTR
jgi:hypothetical protein